MGRRKAKPTGTRETEPERRIRREFARRVRELREAAGATQGEIAARCKLSKVYYGTMELGKKSASLETIAKLAHGLGVTPAELLRFDAPPADPSPHEQLGRRVAALASRATREQIAKLERLVALFLEGP